MFVLRLSCLIPHQPQNLSILLEGDYVTSKQLNFNNTSKIFKIHKIIDHEVVLLNFNEEPINKDMFEKRVMEYKNKEQKYEYYDSLGDGGSMHMNKPMHKLMETYGKDISYMTMEQILEEKTLINNM